MEVRRGGNEDLGRGVGGGERPVLSFNPSRGVSGSEM